MLKRQSPFSEKLDATKWLCKIRVYPIAEPIDLWRLLKKISGSKGWLYQEIIDLVEK